MTLNAFLTLTFAFLLLTPAYLNAQEKKQHHPGRDTDNVLKFFVNKDTTEDQLDFLEQQLKEKQAVLEFKGKKRNNKNELTQLKIRFVSGNQKKELDQESTSPIKPVAISINPSTGTIGLDYEKEGLSQTFEVSSEIDGSKKLLPKSAKEQ